MLWQFISVGKPALPWARDAFSDYLSRLSKHTRVEHLALREGQPHQVARQMLAASHGSLRVVLDESGEQRRSIDLAKWVERQELTGRKSVSLLVGGANGHPPEVRAAADETWALSLMTLQHEMALVLLAEQVYRAYTILRKEPYHRE